MLPQHYTGAKTTTPTMSSVELVDVINSARDEGKPQLRHDTFLNKIAKVLGDNGQNFMGVYKGGNGQDRPCYYLPKREANLMVMSESYAVQAKVYDRMTELEAAPAPSFALPATFAAALRLAAAQAEQLGQQAAKISADAPKVAFAEAIRAVDGVCSIEKIAKTLRIGRNKFFKRLREDSILLTNNLPYQKYIDREYFTVVEGAPWTDSKDVSHPTFTTMVTGAGQVFLARKYGAAVPAELVAA